MKKPQRNKPKKRSYNIRCIKLDLSYEIEEIARLLCVSRGTVRNWLKAGLKRIDNSRPYLIHGRDLEDFLKRRRSLRRKPCKDDEMYCFRCRYARKAWGGMADLQIKNDKQAILCTLCEECEGPIRRVISRAKLPSFEKALVIVKQPQAPLGDCPETRLNDH